MARTFAASEYYEHANGLYSTAMTLGCFVRPSTVTGEKTAMGAGSSVTGNNFYQLGFDGTTVRFSLRGGSLAVAAIASKAVQDEWQFIGARQVNAGARDVYWNGDKGNNGTNIGSDPVPTHAQVAGVMVNNSIFNKFSGRIEYPTWWDIDLTDAELLAFSLGMNPAKIRPDRITAAPWLLDDQPEKDFRTGIAWTEEVGTPTLSTGAPVIPYSARLWGGFTEAGAASGNVEIDGVSAVLEIAGNDGSVEISPNITGASAILEVEGGVGSTTILPDLQGDSAQIDLDSGDGTATVSPTLGGSSGTITLTAGTGSLEIPPELEGVSAQFDLVANDGDVDTSGALLGISAEGELVGGVGSIEIVVSLQGVGAVIEMVGGDGDVDTSGALIGVSAVIEIEGGTGEVVVGPGTIEIEGSSATIVLTTGAGTTVIKPRIDGVSAQTELSAGTGTVGAVYVDGAPLARMIVNVPLVRQVVDVPLARQVQK